MITLLQILNCLSRAQVRRFEAYVTHLLELIAQDSETPTSAVEAMVDELLQDYELGIELTQAQSELLSNLFKRPKSVNAGFRTNALKQGWE